MGKRVYLNNGWKYSGSFDREMICPNFNDTQMENVRIPHSVSVTGFNYFDDAEYQKISCYRKSFKAEQSWKNKRVILKFMGAAHEAVVYLNGEELGKHSGGYTAFSFDISDKIVFDAPNVLVVKLDSNENLNVPPFGFVVDYMTYGGIYRDVLLEVSEPTYVSDVFVYSDINKLHEDMGQGEKVLPQALGTFICSEVKVSGDTSGCVLRHLLKRISGDIPEGYKDEYKDQKMLLEVKADKTVKLNYHISPVVLWDIGNPALYEYTVQILRNDDLIDEKKTVFGFRKSEFRADGYYLNGRKVLLRGLNRHQSYPYVGYAMPASIQKEDARILKEELSVNAVRTSHYPQSQDFIDECDRLGLLVFMEFPGWQHIGDEEWKEQALVNEREMIEQYRNHPSIIIWGVRINESADDDEFYTKTNALSHELDSTRPTGGVRAAGKMHLLEDVYTYNDFSHKGDNDGCQKKKAVTPNMDKPYLVTEYNGHMYPTKTFDAEEHRLEHAMRHVKVMDAIAGEEDISGGFGWCMFDYNTHKDFGSGDRICYHGVMDMFRNPKLAATVYGMQGDSKDVLELSSSMDIGEHPASTRGDIWIYTNADSVKMYKNDNFIKEYKTEDTPYKNLKKGPVLIDDFIGDMLKDNEKFSAGMAERVKHALNTAARYGMDKLGLADLITGARMMTFHRMSTKDIVDLYQKYIGDWGGKATSFKFEAIKNGKVVKTLVKETVSDIDIELNVSSTHLYDDRSYDAALVRIKVVDQNGNVLPYFNEPITFKTEGAIELIGPEVVSTRGGMTGVFVKTRPRQGSKGKLTIKLNHNKKIRKEVVFKVKEGADFNV